MSADPAPGGLDRLLAAAGIAAPLVYLATVVLGAAAIPGYSHLHDPISGLTESGRQGVLPIQLGLAAYNLLLAGFAGGALRAFGRRPAWRWTFALLLLTAAAGLLMWPFAQDPIGAPATFTGIVHILLAAVESVSSIAVMILSALALRARRQGLLAVLALLCLVVTVPSGAVAGLSAANNWPMMGLFERFTIGGFEAWLMGIALIAALRPGVLAAGDPPP